MSREVQITRDDNWFQGEDVAFQIAVVDSNEAGASPVNMTGYTLLWQLFSAQTPDGAELIVKSGADITLVSVDGTNDAAKIQLADTDTIATGGTVTVAAGEYWHELWRVDEGNERMLAFGKAVLRPSRRRQETS